MRKAVELQYKITGVLTVHGLVSPEDFFAQRRPHEERETLQEAAKLCELYEHTTLASKLWEMAGD